MKRQRNKDLASLLTLPSLACAHVSPLTSAQGNTEQNEVPDLPLFRQHNLRQQLRQLCMLHCKSLRVGSLSPPQVLQDANSFLLVL